MHAHLKKCIDELAQFWKNDPRVRAFSMNGSGGRGDDDEWSDGDVVLVVSDESHDAVCHEIPGLMARFGDIRMCMLEGEGGPYRSYSSLFEYNGEQFLFDHAVARESVFADPMAFDAGVIYYDNTGVLTGANQRFKDRKTAFDPSKLPELIDMYLVFTYLNGKFYRRKDALKMVYAQTTLQTTHIQLLGALYPDHGFSEWWYGDFPVLSPEHQQTILLYAAPPDCDEIALLVRRELARFGKDARAACALYGIAYPEELEKFVLRQLNDAGLPG